MERALEHDYRVTVDEFHALVDERPDDEHWELIDGEPILNATANRRHQVIVRNIIMELGTAQRETNAPWFAIPGIGVQHPDDKTNEPVPDVAVLPSAGDDAANWTHDILVAFEVLSRWSGRRDMFRKRGFYTRLDPLTHYVVVAQDEMRAHVFAREAGFEPAELSDPDAMIAFEALGASLRLGDLYRDVAVG